MQIRITHMALLATALFLNAAVTRAEDSFGPDTVVVSRGGGVITMNDVDALVGQLDPKVRPGYMNDPERIEKVLSDLLVARQFAQEAINGGLRDTKVFEDRMRLAGDMILMQMQIEDHLAKLQVPDLTDLARERYLADDGSVFGKPPRRDLSHILISNKSRDDQAAHDLANELLARIRAGERFDDLAKIYSDDKPAGQAKGPFEPQFWRMEGVPKGKTDPSFEQAAWALSEIGEISAVVKSQFGYHIIRLDAVVPMEKVPFESVQKAIVERLQADWIKKQRDDYITSFKAMPLNAKAEVVASLRTRYAAGEADGQAVPSGTDAGSNSN